MRRREAGWSHEKRLRTRGYRAVAGVDEVGRGCLAGPVVAGAVILASRRFGGLADSKTLPPARRELAARRIVRRARDFAFGVVGPEEIDRTDILRATLLAMRRAIEGLREPPDYVLVDALTIPGIEAPQEGIVGGDGSIASIAAASILAKVFRDAMMRAYHVLHPVYGFDRHAGYGTRRHLEALRRFGPNHLHRLTFRGVLPPDVAPAVASSGSH